MVQIRAYQVNPGGSTPTHIHANDAEKTLLEIIAPELEKSAAWQNGAAYLNRSLKADVHHNLGKEYQALVFDAPAHKSVMQLSEKLEAALIMSGVLRRTGKAVYNGSVLYPPGPAVVLVNQEGRRQLENFVAELSEQKLAGCARA